MFALSLEPLPSLATGLLEPPGPGSSQEPPLLVLTDPEANHQLLTEASYVNLAYQRMPCHTDALLRVDTVSTLPSGQ